jgi:hypothetical protein
MGKRRRQLLAWTNPAELKNSGNNKVNRDARNAIFFGEPARPLP